MADDTLLIRYGADRAETAWAAALDRSGGRPLRLADGPYPFAEPPDLVRLTGRAERLDFLREHMKSLCGTWAKLPHLFLDAYFRFVVAALAAHRPELEEQSTAAGGLFEAQDWSFSALRPLPRAHLDAAGGTVLVDFAFWTGRNLVAVDVVSTQSRTRRRLAELEGLERAGVCRIEVPGADLQRAGDRFLGTILPETFTTFWRGVIFPSSPFGTAALDRIEPGESSLG